jgi:hypothetical protein
MHKLRDVLRRGGSAACRRGTTIESDIDTLKHNGLGVSPERIMCMWVQSTKSRRGRLRLMSLPRAVRGRKCIFNLPERAWAARSGRVVRCEGDGYHFAASNAEQCVTNCPRLSSRGRHAAATADSVKFDPQTNHLLIPAKAGIQEQLARALAYVALGPRFRGDVRVGGTDFHFIGGCSNRKSA